MDDHLDGRLNIRVSQALLDRAHERSKRTGISISWLVRRVLALWVSGWQPPAYHHKQIDDKETDDDR